MTFENSILTLLTWLPVLGAAILLFTPKTALNAIRWMALATTLVVFVLSLALWQAFDASSAGFQFVVNMPWIGDSIGYRVGVDGISMLFVMLTTFMMPITIIASCSGELGRRDPRQGIHDRVPGARNADDRRFHHARSGHVLCLL